MGLYLGAEELQLRLEVVFFPFFLALLVEDSVPDEFYPGDEAEDIDELDHAEDPVGYGEELELGGVAVFNEDIVGLFEDKDYNGAEAEDGGESQGVVEIPPDEEKPGDKIVEMDIAEDCLDGDHGGGHDIGADGEGFT